ncbi:MAG: AMP-binding protein, partial [Thermodesulfobacteriota bacterium]
MPERKNLPAQAYEGIVSETYDGVEIRNYGVRPDNLVEMLEGSVARFGDREAVVDGPVRLTYRDYDRLCNNLAASLKKLGVKKGDRVAILMPNSWEYAVSFFGITRLGGIAVLLNWRCAGPELEYMLKDSGAVCLLMHADYWPTIDGVEGNLESVKAIYVQGVPPPEGTLAFDDLIEKDAAERVVSDPPVTQEDPAA